MRAIQPRPDDEIQRPGPQGGRCAGFLVALRPVVVAPRPRQVAAGLGVLLGISLLLHAWLIASSPGAFFDIVSYRIQAATVFDHQNVYAVTERYPYPPVWIWIVAGLRGLATLIQVPFDALVRAPATLGDLGIGVVLYGYARDRIGAGWRALTPSALYLLNPAVLLISAAHGQFDSLVILFVLLAFYLRGPYHNRRWFSAALALGIAIALKGFPILLLPYLALTTPSLRECPDLCRGVRIHAQHGHARARVSEHGGLRVEHPGGGVWAPGCGPPAPGRRVARIHHRLRGRGSTPPLPEPPRRCHHAPVRYVLRLDLVDERAVPVVDHSLPIPRLARGRGGLQRRRPGCRSCLLL
jgi:hypothetical protein